MLDMLHEIRTFSEKVAKLADQQESEDAILCDAPEDYLDRSNIFRMLGSDKAVQSTNIA